MGELNPRREAHRVAIAWAAITIAVRVAWLAYQPAIAGWDGAMP